MARWLRDQTCDGQVKRRRNVSRPQRLAANERERRRMDSLNLAFDQLRARVPTSAPQDGSGSRRLSRIQTLRFAIEYIACMADMLRGGERSGVGGDVGLGEEGNGGAVGSGVVGSEMLVVKMER